MVRQVARLVVCRRKREQNNLNFKNLRCIMAKIKQQSLDFARLRKCVGKAAALAGEEFGEEGLVSYLRHQALEKPNAFMALLLKVVLLEGQEEAAKKAANITHIEIVAPEHSKHDGRQELYDE